MSEPAVETTVKVLHPEDLKTTTPLERPPLQVRSFGMTDPGKVRPSNQDQFLIAQLCKSLQVRQTSLDKPPVQEVGDRGYLFIVADGMGGHSGGETASALAIDSVETFLLGTFKWFLHFRGKEGQELLAEFQQALGHADARLFQEAARHPELRGMGTTLTMAFYHDGHLFVAHAGDCRCYLLRDGELHRLTHDHTLVEEMVQRGLLNPVEAAQHRLRHVVTNSVGGNEPGVRVDVYKVPLEAGDCMLLCSDGLTGMVQEDEIAATLQEEPEPEKVCRRLVARANEQGGRDNITLIVARFEPARAKDR